MKLYCTSSSQAALSLSLCFGILLVYQQSSPSLLAGVTCELKPLVTLKSLLATAAPMLMEYSRLRVVVPVQYKGPCAADFAHPQNARLATPKPIFGKSQTSKGMVRVPSLLTYPACMNCDVWHTALTGEW